MTPRERPDAGNMVRPRPEEQELDRGSTVAARAAVGAPALVVLGCGSAFLPIMQSWGLLVAIVLLGFAPAVLSLAWLPGGDPRRARTATVITVALVAVAIGWLGLQANPCATDPTVIGLVGAGMGLGTVLLAASFGRALASRGRMVAALLVAGAIGFVGFFLTAGMVLPAVFVLC